VVLVDPPSFAEAVACGLVDVGREGRIVCAAPPCPRPTTSLRLWKQLSRIVLEQLGNEEKEQLLMTISKLLRG
jgi:hypothetical protein